MDRCLDGFVLNIGTNLIEMYDTSYLFHFYQCEIKLYPRLIINIIFYGNDNCKIINDKNERCVIFFFYKIGKLRGYLLYKILYKLL